MKSSFDIYLKGAAGAIIVEDMRNKGDGDRVKEWREVLREKTGLVDGRPIPCITLYNKCDLEHTDEVMGTGEFNVSAKTGENIK